MGLNLTRERTEFPKTHFVFIEKIGPFQQTAQAAWQELHRHKTEISNITSAMAVFRMQPQMVYRAGFIVSARPQKLPETLPEGLQYEEIASGLYHRFVLTGGYAQLPTAWGQTLEAVKAQKLPVNADAFYIEHYVTDPTKAPESEWATALLIPAKAN